MYQNIFKYSFIFIFFVIHSCSVVRNNDDVTITNKNKDTWGIVNSFNHLLYLTHCNIYGKELSSRICADRKLLNTSGSIQKISEADTLYIISCLTQDNIYKETIATKDSVLISFSRFEQDDGTVVVKKIDYPLIDIHKITTRSNQLSVSRKEQSTLLHIFIIHDIIISNDLIRSVQINHIKDKEP